MKWLLIDRPKEASDAVPVVSQAMNRAAKGTDPEGSGRRGSDRLASVLEDVPPQDLTPAVASALAALQAENIGLKRELARVRSNFASLERIADRDPLVPVLNRRAFLREFSRVKSLVERYQFEASLIFIDLNDFKLINDRFGHATGDVALQKVADILKRNVRESDVAGRLGGDEFGILLVNANVDIAMAKARSLDQHIQACEIECGGESVELSASYGIWPIDPMTDLNTVLARADEAMYQNKRQSKVERDSRVS